MFRLPVWMLAVGLVGCLGTSPQDDDDDDAWGEESSDGDWNGGSGSGTGSGGGSGGGSGDGGGSGGESGDDAAGPEDADGGCESEIVQTYPADGSMDVYYRAKIGFKFDGIDEGATIQVFGETDGHISGSTSWIDSTLWFEADSGLQPNSNYTAFLDFCYGNQEISFFTSSAGESLEVPTSDLVGRTYALNLDAGRVLEPAGVGPLLFGLLDRHLMIGVTAASSSTISLMGAVSESGSVDQDYCEPSIGYPESADFTDSPFFETEVPTLTMRSSGYDVTLQNVTISGTFEPDGSEIAHMVFIALMDARDLVDALVGGGLLEDDDPNAVCDLIATFGVACGECSDGEEYCLNVHVDQVPAPETGSALEWLDECDPERCSAGCSEE
jgi:hypothetical protein